MIVLEQISVTSTEYAPHSGYHSWPLLFLWRLNWSLLAYLLSHCKHSYGLSPLCSLAVVWWRVRSLRRVKPLVHPSSLQTNLRSAFLVPLPVPFLVCLRRRRVHPSCQSSSDESSRSDVYSGRRLSFLGRFLVDWDDDRPAITSFPEVVTDCRDVQISVQIPSDSSPVPTFWSSSSPSYLYSTQTPLPDSPRLPVSAPSVYSPPGDAPPRCARTTLPQSNQIAW